MFLVITFLSMLFMAFLVGGILSEAHAKDSTFIVSIITFPLLIILVVCGVSFSVNTNTLAGLNLQNEVNIPNQISLVKSLNTKVLIHNDSTHLIVDVANLGQSAKNTEEWKSLVNSINTYNNDLLQFYFAKNHYVMAFIHGGFYPDHGDLRYIKLNEI